MYKNLNCELLGISGRQSEIIELALTYGFRGIDLDIDDLVKRCSRSSFESASRFLSSSKLNVATFQAPIDLDCDDETFTAKCAQLNVVAEIAGRVNASVAVVSVPAATDRLPYPEYFEVIRQRISQIAEVFAKENINVALTFSPQEAATDEKEFKFIRDVEGFVALFKACTNPNVGIVFDSWDWHIGGGSPETLDTIELSKVLAVRISDCKEGFEAAAATEDDCVLPGSTGVIDNVTYLKKFVEAGVELSVAARGLPGVGNATRRDAFISSTQDVLDKTFEETGIPSVTRRPDMFGEPSYASNSQPSA